MRIFQNFGVRSDKRRVENAGCGDNDLISRVAMKCAGQLRGFNADARRKFDKTNARIRECLLKPIGDRTWQGKPTALDEFGNLPA